MGEKGIAKTTMKIYNTAVALAPVDTSWLRESISYEFYDGGFSSKINVGADYAIKRMSQLLVTVI